MCVSPLTSREESTSIHCMKQQLSVNIAGMSSFRRSELLRRKRLAEKSENDNRQRAVIIIVSGPVMLDGIDNKSNDESRDDCDAEDERNACACAR